MNNLVLQSSLTWEEIEDNFKDFDVFTAFMQSLKEADSYERGKLLPGAVVRYRSAEHE